MVDIRLTGVSVVLDGTPVLVDIDADIPDRKIAAVIGPSGSGKSSLLRALAGLVAVSSGRIEMGGHDVTARAPGDRDIGMVFQMPAMLPRRNVRRNISFPLEVRRETLESIRQRVTAESRAMQIEHLLLRDPGSLSRGEQQLVQIARTMVRAPGTLLLDEPFAPLDAHLRVALRSEIGMLQRGYGVTTVMATNDPDDMRALADHLVVLGQVDAGANGFTVVQSGPVGEVVGDPVSLEVAAAVSPLWQVTAKVTSGSPGYWLTIGNGSGGRVRAWSPALEGWVGRDVVLGFRTGDLRVHPHGDVLGFAERLVPGEVDPLVCRVAGRPVQCASGPFDASTIRDRPPVRLEPRQVLVFDAGSGRRIR